MFSETPLIRRKLRMERMAKWVFGLMVAAMVLPLVLIVGYLVARAWPVLGWDFITEFPRKRMTEGGIYPALVGTLYMVVTSVTISSIVGVLAAVYLNEYAGDNWFTRVVNLAVLNLAGVPSIVHALFGVGAFVLLTGRPCIMAASLTLGVMTLPVIIASTKESLAAVPASFREASWNVGATRWQTIRAIVLPNSISGILTGLILQVSRAAGETAPIMFTGAVFFKALSGDSMLGYGLMDQCMALSMHLFTISTQVQDVPAALPYGTAVVLMGIVLACNAVAIGFRVYLRSRSRW